MAIISTPQSSYVTEIPVHRTAIPTIYHHSEHFTRWHTDCILKVMIPKIGRNISASTMTWLRAGEFGVRNPVEATSSPRRPYRLRSPLSLLYNGYQGSFPGVKRPSRKMTICLYLAPRLGMSGDIPLFPLYDFMARGGTTVPYNDSEMAEGQVTCHTQPANSRITMRFSQIFL